MKDEQPSATNKASQASTEKVYSRKDVREMLKEKREEVAALREELRKAYEAVIHLQRENKALKEKRQEKENPGDGYRKDWTWVRKIVFVLERAGKPLRSAEIIEELAKREAHLRDHWNQAQYFSAFLNKAMKEERIGREKRRGERGFYYSVRNGESSSNTAQ